MLPLEPQVINRLYQEQGYVVLRKVFDGSELSSIGKVLEEFHRQWLLNC